MRRASLYYYTISAELVSLRAENEKQKDMRMCKICACSTIDRNPGTGYDTLLLQMIIGDLLSAFPLSNFSNV